MENEHKNRTHMRAPEADIFLQWGNRKRLRRVKIRKEGVSDKSNGSVGKIATLSPPFHSPGQERTSEIRERQSRFPEEKEDRFYPTRGSGLDDNRKVLADCVVEERKGFVWPKFYISLSSKEKEEDFMAMKGCKLPQRPKKRAKYIQRSIHLVCPGGWLSDVCLERYEVREKKSSKKSPRGLKAMGGEESDSD